MKYVKLFEDFSSQETLTEDQIDWLNKCAIGTLDTNFNTGFTEADWDEGSWSVNPSTGLIDVDGDFECIQQNLTDFKGVRFGHIKGNFNCGGNLLTDLKGAPKTVDDGFYCKDNELTSLEGAPQTVGGGFSCEGNQLTDLEGAPQKVGGFSCDGNQLTSLVGAPQKVGGSFYFADNPVSEETLSSIFALMKKGKSYQQALTECWPKMGSEDRALMYKDLKDLTRDEIRRYNALTTINRIKNYL
jgi:hypothetical protein